MNHTEKNGVLVVLILCMFSIPILIHAQVPSESTAAQKIEEIRQREDVTNARTDCQTAENNGVNATGGNNSGDYVPVHETGDLLEASQKSEGLTFQICMYTKALKRIQYEWETKEYITNPDAFKNKANSIGTLRKEYFYGDDTKKAISGSSYITTKEEETAKAGQPIYVTNTAQRMQQVGDETQNIFLKDVENAKPIFAQTIQRSVAQDSAVNASDQTRLSQRLKSDFSSQQEFTDFTSDFSKGGWDAWLKIIQPNNNPYGQYLIAQDELSLRRSQAEQNAREEVLAGGGFLPNRTCEEWDSLLKPDGYSQQQFCRKWKVLTPATAQQSQYNQLWGATLDQAIAADQQTEDLITPELTNDAISIRQGIGAGTSNPVDSIFGKDKPEPCIGPDPCPNTGWAGSGSHLPGDIGGDTGGVDTMTDNSPRDGIPDYLALPANQNLYPDLSSFLSQLIGLTQQQVQAQVAQYIATHKPSIKMTASTPSLADTASGIPAVIRWEVFNATKCYATNDWYKRGTRNGNDFWEGSYIARRAGDELPRTGNGTFASIDLPIRVPIDFVNSVQYTTNSVYNNPYLTVTRNMVTLTPDSTGMVETATITVTPNPAFFPTQGHDLLIGGLDGRTDNLGRATGERPVIHATAGTCPTFGQVAGPNKLVKALQTEADRRRNIIGDSAQRVLQNFSLIFTTDGECKTPSFTGVNDIASITIVPLPTYRMMCQNNNSAPNNQESASVTLTRP